MQEVDGTVEFGIAVSVKRLKLPFHTLLLFLSQQ